jgi:WD40 repeat protein
VCFVTGNKVAVVTDKSVGLWSWESGVRSHSISAQVLLKGNLTDLTQRNKKTIRMSPAEQSLTMHNIKYQELGCSTCASYTCATLSNDCQYIIVGSSNFSISVWDVELCSLVKEYQNHNG